MYTVTHCEIPAVNTDKAAKFYQELFGWKGQKMGEMDYYVLSIEGSKQSIGIAKVDKVTSSDASLNYVEVPDIEETLAKAEKLGGKTTDGKRALPAGMGYIATFADPHGFLVGLWSA